MSSSPATARRALLGHIDPCKNSIRVVYTGIHVDDNAMTIAKTRTFRSGNSEAIRLPKDVAFGEGVELVVVRSGDVVTLYPAATSIPEMIARLDGVATSDLHRGA